MSASRRRRAEEPEEHENHERWLVTYADMVTLLMVLFIVMFAMSAVDERKFNALKAGLAAGFGQSTSLLDGSSSLLEQPGMSAAEPLSPQEYRELPEIEQVAMSRALLGDQQAAERAYAEARAELDRLERIRDEILAALRRQGLEDDVQMSIDDRGLVMSLVSRHVVFEPDLAELSDRGRRVLEVVAPVLRPLPDPLRIDGHTNQVPVKPRYYPTDWELSAARAVTVLRHLQESGRIPRSRMMASAFGHEKPLVDPDRAGSQRVNKRVDVVVVSGLPPESRELLATLATTGRHPGGVG